MSEFNDDWNKLDNEHKEFVLRVREGCGGKHAAEPHSMDSDIPLKPPNEDLFEVIYFYEKAEASGFIECVGSWKWLVTDKFNTLEDELFGINQQGDADVSEEITISKHAKDRMKERVGIPKRASLKLATKAYNEGVNHSQARGRLHRYMSKLFLDYRTANNIRVLGKHIYIFAGTHLITVMHLPKNMNGAAKKSSNDKGTI